MATTNEDLMQEDQEFSSAFNEPEAEKPTVSEDEAFGLMPEAEDGTSSAGEQGEPPAATLPPKGGEQTAAEPAVTEAAAPADGGQPQGLTKEEQQEKSWEGRLRAREAELQAREEALKALEEAAKNGKPAGDGQAVAHAGEETPAEERAENAETGAALSEVVKQVEDGDMTAEQAMAQLSGDFGPEFAKAVSALIKQAALDTATKVADEKVGAVSKSIDELISGITDKSARDHFEAIAEAHPDFAEMADGDDLKGYLASLPEDKRATADQVIAKGSARQIIRLLSDVKAFAAKNHGAEDEAEMAAADPEVSKAMDAAEGVRSKGGLQIPKKPSAADDYESAWNDFE